MLVLDIVNRIVILEFYPIIGQSRARVRLVRLALRVRKAHRDVGDVRKRIVLRSRIAHLCRPRLIGIKHRRVVVGKADEFVLGNGSDRRHIFFRAGADLPAEHNRRAKDRLSGAVEN